MRNADPNHIDNDPATELLARLFAGRQTGLGMFDLAKLATGCQRWKPADLLAAAVRRWRADDPDAVPKMRSLFGL